jgi:hypothetical protein
MDHEDKIAALKVSVGAGSAAIYGLTLNEWVAIFTIAYLVLQIGLLLPKYYRNIRDYIRNLRGV